MESRQYDVHSAHNEKLKISIIPGHFATNHSHVNYYLNMTEVKSSHVMAHNAAQEIAGCFPPDQAVDTFVCLEGTEIIAAYLAEQLNTDKSRSVNILTPEFNINNQMIFRDNTQRMIWGKKIALLLSSITTGKTVNRALECIRYYGGEIMILASVFSAIDNIQGIPVVSVFSQDDVRDYKTWLVTDCPKCAENQRVDAIINSSGYTRI